MARKRTIKLTIRLTVGQDDDLLAWLEGLQIPWGQKGLAVKDALRGGIGSAGAVSPMQLHMDVLLPEIRRVVEAGVAAALAGIAFQPQAGRTGDQDEQADQILDLLGQNLILEE